MVVRQGNHPLVGRARELARVGVRIDDGVSGSGCFVLVSGEPGIGKSRLAAAAADAAQARGFITAWGSCRETEGAPPYWPWAQLLRGVLRDRMADRELLAPLLLAGQHSAHETDRFRLFDNTVQVLGRVAEAQPLLLVLDDLHRADDASLMLLRFVVAAVREQSLVLLGTYRNTEVPAVHPLALLVGEVAGDPLFDLIELAGLSRSDTAEFLRCAGDAGVEFDPGALYERTDGNPFFLTELLRLGAHSAAGIPATIEAAIRVRSSRLPGTCRELLALAAVLGRDIETDTLAAVSAMSPSEVVATLGPALDCGLVIPHPTAVGDYRFTHVLTQQTLYAALTPARRVELHDRVTAVLEATVGADPSYAVTLAHHAGAAIGSPGGRDRAHVLACRAAEAAAVALADETAAVWFTRALALLSPGDSRRMPLLLALGRAVGRAGRVDEARQAYEQAWAIANRSQSTSGLTEAALGLGEVVVSAGTVDAGLVRMLERTLSRVPDAEPTQRVRLNARLATELYWGGGLERARGLAAEAVSTARTFGEPRTLAAAVAANQFVLRGPEDLGRRLALGEELLRIAARLDDEELELHARRILIPDRLQHDLTGADAELEGLAVLAEVSRRPLARWYLTLYRTIRATMTGQAGAMALADEAEAIGSRLGVQPASLYAVSQRFMILRRMGRVHEAEDSVRHHAARWPVLVTFRCMLALLLAETGRTEEARILLDDLVAGGCAALPHDSLWLASVAILAEVAASIDHPEHAAVLDEVLAPYTGRVAVQGVVVWWGAVDHYLARTATTLGRWDLAEARFRSALRQHQAWGATPFVNDTLATHADMLRRRGAPGDGERAEQMTAQAGDTPRPQESRPPEQAGLTRREQEVLQQLASGSSNKEIARRFSLSVHTVERHIANIYAKIGARNRAEATAYALQTR
jgi:DNA-binding CsgD family transcriptional regulator